MITTLSPQIRTLYLLASTVFAWALILRLVYIFAYSDYSAYLASDAQAYWWRAIAFLAGDRSIIQWEVWPPMVHIGLAGLMALFDSLALSDLRLPLVLITQAIASSFSALVFFMVLQDYYKLRTAFVMALAYSALLPLVYIDAFVLSESFGLCFLLMSLYFLISQHHNNPILAGLFLTLLISFKPLFILLAPLYLLFSLKQKGAKNTALFIFSLLLSCAVVLMFLYVLSDGQLLGFGQAGGINFYMKNCQVHQLIWRGDHRELMFIPAMWADRPDLLKVVAEAPFYQQGVFYKKGLACVLNQPNTVLLNAASVKQLFVGNMYPSYFHHDGFLILFNITRYAMAGLAFLVSVLWVTQCVRRKTIAFNESDFLAVVLLSYIAVCAWFNTDSRHSLMLYPLLLWMAAIMFAQWFNAQAAKGVNPPPQSTRSSTANH